MWKAFLTIESHKTLRNEQPLFFYPNYDDDIWLTHGLWLQRGGVTNHSLLKHCSAGSCFEDCWIDSYNRMLLWQSTPCRFTTVLQPYIWMDTSHHSYLYVWNIQFSFELADSSVREIQKHTLVNITVQYYNIQPSANVSMPWSLLYHFPPSLTLQ